MGRQWQYFAVFAFAELSPCKTSNTKWQWKHKVTKLVGLNFEMIKHLIMWLLATSLLKYGESWFAPELSGTTQFFLLLPESNQLKLFLVQCFIHSRLEFESKITCGQFSVNLSTLEFSEVSELAPYPGTTAMHYYWLLILFILLISHSHYITTGNY